MNASDPAAGRWNDRRTLWMLVALLPLAFAARVLVAGDAFGSDGEILIARNDASYHARRALYTFENFPRILWFDSYLAWPDGADVTAALQEGLQRGRPRLSFSWNGQLLEKMSRSERG